MEIKLEQLSPEQLRSLQAQFKEKRKTVNEKRGDRYVIIDRMLQEKDGDTFKHTTSDILAELQNAKLVDSVLGKDERADWIKKIQTHKQSLEKETNKDTGKLVYPEGTFGYKPSAGGFGLTTDRIVDWLMNDDNVKKLSPADKKAILKQLS